ncbi:response regulator transcription factor [Clostridium baratii]|uniref:response regulator transcription factor n=1 Tax=Clostridium baratii TaxID=1561 RepID=UPI0005F2FDF0|nr:response regulator transcription factor [Clostridium baratii]AQM59181.1 DNA-binding response regulator [Clostridium baratii]KJU72565.1 transcriptional regulator [Clostridium baratii]
MKKILVVEDDPKIRELIVEFLKCQDYKIDSAKDGIEGYSKFKEEDYDLIILDVMMPKLDGYGLCNLIREESDIPIIFLTALNEDEDQIKAFDAMADDFITKPFSFHVLIKRVEAVLRRSNTNNMNKDILTFDSIELNLNTYKCYVGGEEIELTFKEFNILKIMIESYPNVVSREILMDKVWGYDYYGDMRVIDAHIKNLRKKIPKDCISTVKGVGYVLKK